MMPLPLNLCPLRDEKLMMSAFLKDERTLTHLFDRWTFSEEARSNAAITAAEQRNIRLVEKVLSNGPITTLAHGLLHSIAEDQYSVKLANLLGVTLLPRGVFKEYEKVERERLEFSPDENIASEIPFSSGWQENGCTDAAIKEKFKGLCAWHLSMTDGDDEDTVIIGPVSPTSPRLSTPSSETI